MCVTFKAHSTALMVFFVTICWLIVAASLPSLAIGIVTPTGQPKKARILPVRSLDIAVTVADGCAVTRVIETLRNESAKPIIMTYLHYLPDDRANVVRSASVDGMPLDVNILSWKDNYKQIGAIIAPSPTAALISRATLFIAKQIPIAAKSETTVRIEYMSALMTVEGIDLVKGYLARYYYPLSIYKALPKPINDYSFSLVIPDKSGFIPPYATQSKSPLPHDKPAQRETARKIHYYKPLDDIEINIVICADTSN
jgi:hypothetical protein